jgi:hypothetical protein
MTAQSQYNIIKQEANNSNKQTNKQNDCPEPIQHYQTRSKQQ